MDVLKCMRMSLCIVHDSLVPRPRGPGNEAKSMSMGPGSLVTVVGLPSVEALN